MNTNRHIITALLCTASICAFNNKAGWKTDADGKIETDADGNPIMIGADGREMTVRSNTVLDLQNEAKQHRTAKEAVEEKLKAFEGIDPEKAKQAMATVADIDASKLINADKLDEVKRAIATEYQAKLDERDGVINTQQAKIDAMIIDTAFATSDFVRDSLNIPTEMFKATFRERFKVEDGKLIALDTNGGPLMSKKHLGETPNFEEAISLIVDAYPHKDQILRAPDAGGTGGNGGGGNRGQSRTLRRAEFDSAPPHQQAQYAAAQSKGELTIVD